jgi:hypothetical protein
VGEVALEEFEKVALDRLRSECRFERGAGRARTVVCCGSGLSPALSLVHGHLSSCDFAHVQQQQQQQQQQSSHAADTHAATASVRLRHAPFSPALKPQRTCPPKQSSRRWRSPSCAASQMTRSRTRWVPCWSGWVGAQGPERSAAWLATGTCNQVAHLQCPTSRAVLTTNIPPPDQVAADQAQAARQRGRARRGRAQGHRQPLHPAAGLLQVRAAAGKTAAKTAVIFAAVGEARA